MTRAGVGAPAGSAPEARPRVLPEDEAAAWVLALLRDGKARTTREVDEAARSQGVSCPDGTARFLARMQRRGLLAGELDVAAKSWRWWLA